MKKKKEDPLKGVIDYAIQLALDVKDQYTEKEKQEK